MSSASHDASEALTEQWLAHDRAGARDRAEAAAMHAARAVRHWIVARWLETKSHTPDTLSGFAQLGRVLAEEQISCASALGSVTSFGAVLPDVDPASLAAARSALGDAFVETRLEHERKQLRVRFDQAWLELEPGVAAIVADPPTDDVEWLGAWADRLTGALLRQKIRRTYLRVDGDAGQALRAALELVGIEPIDQSSASARHGTPSRSWLRRLGL